MAGPDEEEQVRKRGPGMAEPVAEGDAHRVPLSGSSGSLGPRRSAASGDGREESDACGSGLAEPAEAVIGCRWTEGIEVAGERSGRDAGTGQPSGRDATAGQRLDADDPENASSPARASAGEPPLRGEGGAAPATGAAERGAKLPGLRSGSPDAGAALFGPYLEAAHRYAELLADTGISHGLLGPHEADRVWDRHVMNCGVLAELIEPNARVLDLGSGGGLPGIPLALARPDLEIVLLEPLERRTAWLRETVETIAPSVRVVRGRAEEPAIRRAWSGADIVTARAVAPLNRLAAWAMPLLRLDGRLLAIKGASAHEEAARDRAAVGRCGGSTPRVVRCGSTHVDPPTTVVVVRRTAARLGPREPRPGRRRQR